MFFSCRYLCARCWCAYFFGDSWRRWYTNLRQRTHVILISSKPNTYFHGQGVAYQVWRRLANVFFIDHHCKILSQWTEMLKNCPIRRTSSRVCQESWKNAHLTVKKMQGLSGSTSVKYCFAHFFFWRTLVWKWFNL